MSCRPAFRPNLGRGEAATEPPKHMPMTDWPTPASPPPPISAFKPPPVDPTTAARLLLQPGEDNRLDCFEEGVALADVHDLSLGAFNFKARLRASVCTTLRHDFCDQFEFAIAHFRASNSRVLNVLIANREIAIYHSSRFYQTRTLYLPISPKRFARPTWLLETSWTTSTVCLQPHFPFSTDTVRSNFVCSRDGRPGRRRHGAEAH
jgi:hypothetical protein